MSSPPLRVFLTREQDRMLLELRKVDGVPQRTKEDEIAGRMFDDEYDLAMAVIESIDSRSERRGYKAERFRFKHR